MRKLFYISEKRLLEFLEYVPIKKRNLNVESPMIYHMMMSSGPQIEPMMRKLVELITPQHIRGEFGECYEILNQKSMLETQKVITKEIGIMLNPFTDSNPLWWQAYNSHTKHRLPEGMEKATLRNLLNIHASLFVLHSIANLRHFIWGEMKENRGIFLDKSNWIDLEEDLKNGKTRTCW